MGKFVVIIEPTAQLEIKVHLKSGNKAVIKKIEKIILELTASAFTGTGNPEALKYNLTGLWSIRISQKDRLIYSVDKIV